MSKIIITEDSLNYLAESILHWKENLEAAKDGKSFSYHGDSCPLCRAYCEHECKNCPIKSFTGLENCKGTPWVHIAPQVMWWRYASENIKNSENIKEPLIEAVENELDFLKEVYEWADDIWRKELDTLVTGALVRGASGL